MYIDLGFFLGGVCVCFFFFFAPSPRVVILAVIFLFFFLEVLCILNLQFNKSTWLKLLKQLKSLW